MKLHWIPPLEPNGDVYYLIQFESYDGNYCITLNTSTWLTSFNLTGLQSGENYNITVVSVNSAGRSDTSPVLYYRHECHPEGEF